MTVILMDGRTLAERRAPALADRAAAVRARRGRSPGLLLVAFADERGRVPHVRGKVRSCEAAGVATWQTIIGFEADTGAAVSAVRTAIEQHAPDGVFVQIPARPGLDEAAILDAIPVGADVDIMTAERMADYLGGATDLAPVTVEAALLTLDGYAVSVAGAGGVVIGEPSPFTDAFGTALSRRGARMMPVTRPGEARLTDRVAAADLVVASAGRPHLLSTADLSTGTIAIDAGYYNPGGRGDIDLSPGTAHLHAIMPVPGGIGPMTVSALVERVILFAERTTASDDTVLAPSRRT